MSDQYNDKRVMEAVSRLKAWVRDYGQSRPEFREDVMELLEAVMVQRAIMKEREKMRDAYASAVPPELLARCEDQKSISRLAEEPYVCDEVRIVDETEGPVKEPAVPLHHNPGRWQNSKKVWRKHKDE